MPVDRIVSDTRIAKIKENVQLMDAEEIPHDPVDLEKLSYLTELELQNLVDKTSKQLEEGRKAKSSQSPTPSSPQPPKEKKKMQPDTNQPTPKPQAPAEKSFSELFAPITGKLDEVVSVVSANTKEVAKLAGSVDEASKRNEKSIQDLVSTIKAQPWAAGGGGTAVTSVTGAAAQPVTVDTLAEALSKRGIGVTPTDGERRGGNGSGDRHNHNHDHDGGWGKRVVWLLALILALIGFGGMLYLFGAFNGVKDTAESAMQLAATANATAGEAKSLAQTAQATANQAMEHDKAQDARLAKLESDVAGLKLSVDNIINRIQLLDKSFADFQSQVNNKVASLLLEVKSIGERADNFEAFVNEVRPQMARLETELKRVGAYVAFNSFAQFFCFFLCGHTMSRGEVKYESPIPPPVQYQPPPAPLSSCSSGLTITDKGTYLVSLVKQDEQGTAQQAGALVVRLCPPAGIQIHWLVLVQFDSVNPNQGQKDNYEDTCQKVGDNTFSCPKVAGYRLRNVRTEINGVTAWGNVSGGTIP